MKDAGHAVGDTLHKAANPGHDYRLPASVTLAFLAGCHGRAALFAASILDVPTKDLYAVNKEIGQEHPFFTRRCLRASVRDAALEALTGMQTDVTAQRVDNAHHLIAIYIGNEPNFFQDNAFTRSIFDRLLSAAGGVQVGARNMGAESPLPVGVSRSAYLGVVAGLCIAGVMRYGQKYDEAADKHRSRFKLALNLAAAAIGGATFPGVGAVTGAITSMADPLAEHLYKKRGVEFREKVIKVAGNLEATIRRTPGLAPGLNRRHLCEAMQETIHRCGYAAERLAIHHLGALEISH